MSIGPSAPKPTWRGLTGEPAHEKLAADVGYPSDARTRARAAAVRAARALARAVPLAEAAAFLGDGDLADRLVARAADDVVGVVVPASPGGRPRRMWMHRHGGDDQVARAIADGGLGAFEPPLPPLFVELVRRFPGVVVDVGANTGLYALLAAAARPSARVYAFEPVPDVAEVLEANVARNVLLARRIEVRRVALAEESGRGRLYLPPPTGTIIETSASLDPTFKESVTAVLDVEVRTLDDVWHGLESPTVGVVKIDTEGTEHLVLRGARAMLASFRPVVVCEVLWRAALDELTAVLSDLDYLDVRLRPDGLVVTEGVAFDPDAWNHAFVAAEKLPALASAVRALGLRIRGLPPLS